ncbi:hypothetical protein BJ508DRAFT_313682 [Ascobolus immersus RN42]|uniref:Uncharacterized protein n=1 Tax=Ascobolus immersus RN42 TaxID=1160509 RepID=A0A3N4HV95_ASCIM|nr:hypothetical protein BJ508DRAFT_313682 [Ascobolus immersus RN42]
MPKSAPTRPPVTGIPPWTNPYKLSTLPSTRESKRQRALILLDPRKDTVDYSQIRPFIPARPRQANPQTAPALTPVEPRPSPLDHLDPSSPHTALATLTPSELRLKLSTLTKLTSHTRHQVLLLHAELCKKSKLLFTTASLHFRPEVTRLQELFDEYWRINQAESARIFEAIEADRVAKGVLERARVKYGVVKLEMAVLAEAKRVMDGVDMEEVKAVAERERVEMYGGRTEGQATIALQVEQLKEAREQHKEVMERCRKASEARERLREEREREREEMRQRREEERRAWDEELRKMKRVSESQRVLVERIMAQTGLVMEGVSEMGGSELEM